jgi:hypothetical protein
MLFSKVIIDKLYNLVFFYIIFKSILELKLFNIQILFNMFDILFNNYILFFSFILFITYLFLKNWKSILIDYLRPYYFIFKQWHSIIIIVVFLVIFF